LKIEDLPGVTPARARALVDAGIRSAEDLVFTFPRRYVDRTALLPIRSAGSVETPVTVFGTITHVRLAGPGGRKRLEVTLRDGSGSMNGIWFHGIAYFKDRFKVGQTAAFFGQVKPFGSSASMVHPDVEIVDSEGKPNTMTGIIPMYPGTAFMKKTYISGQVMQKWVRQVLNETRYEEMLPPDILQGLGFPDRMKALFHIHAPERLADAETALRRFKFEELFLFQLAMAKLNRRASDAREGPRFDPPGAHTRRFFNESLPFPLTDGQRLALTDIRSDTTSGRQMNRLLQGDVGSGKTVVAIGSMLMAVDSGYQAAFMAPTEILAEQHARTLTRWLQPLGLNVRLLTGSAGAVVRRDVLTELASGAAQILVGTHALIQADVRFHRLGLVVVDEQHRFGVEQRVALQQKGFWPHLLGMSATPIPRSLAMTLYSDMDVSVMRDKPAGRQPVRTAVRGERSRDDVYTYLEGRLSEGGQAYVVYPLIDESESTDLKDATIGHSRIRDRFPSHEVALLHGRMPAADKQEVMSRFRAGDIRILVSTTVIEVGVDVPNATVMLIEHAERFGLSQLHQLRGRVGRGNDESVCILMAGTRVSKDGRERLQTMVRTEDGFEIAEADLRLRGPGDVLGTKQSGLPEFRYADIAADEDLLILAKEQAQALLARDPALGDPANRRLAAAFEPYYQKRMALFGA
jgi:ATP-dependent DNA helicase RecG